MVQAGLNLYRVKELLGHRTIRTTERYAHHYLEGLRSCVKVLDERYEEEVGHTLVTVGAYQTEAVLAGKGKFPVVSVSNTRGSG